MLMSKKPMEAIIKEKIIKCQYTLTDSLSNDAKVKQAQCRSCLDDWIPPAPATDR
jgi:hypothetical protein